MKIYKIDTESDSFIFKSISCPLSNTKMIGQIKKAYDISVVCSNLTEGVVKPIDYKETTSKSLQNKIIEILYQYSGENLYSVFRKVDGKIIMDIMIKLLEPLSVLEENNIFHSDINPENIVFKDGDAKLSNLGQSFCFDIKCQLIKLGNAVEKICLYYPPEIIRSESYNTNKVDVYCWGMVLYQMISEKTNSDLENDMKVRSLDYGKFLNSLKNINIRGDKDGSLKKQVLNLLFRVLDINYCRRPSFKILASNLMGIDYYRKILEKTRNERGSYSKNN